MGVERLSESVERKMYLNVQIIKRAFFVNYVADKEAIFEVWNSWSNKLQINSSYEWRGLARKSKETLTDELEVALYQD